MMEGEDMARAPAHSETTHVDDHRLAGIEGQVGGEQVARSGNGAGPKGAMERVPFQARHLEVSDPLGGQFVQTTSRPPLINR